jgi:hypothetical protein
MSEVKFEDVVLYPIEIDGYRFGKITNDERIRYFLIDPENKMVEQYNESLQFIFRSLGSIFTEDYYSEVSGDFNISYRSTNKGVQTYTDGTKIYWCKYKEVGTEEEDSIIRFNSTTGGFE